MNEEKFYYHVTSKDNATKILNEGIKANKEGEIFVFSKYGWIRDTKVVFQGDKVCVKEIMRSVADKIAIEQVGLSDYVILKIDAKGINVEPIADNVAELTANVQWIIRQPLINKDFISIIHQIPIVDEKVIGYLQKPLK